MDFTWQSVYKLEFLVQQCMPSAVIFYYYLRSARRHLYIFLASPFSLLQLVGVYLLLSRSVHDFRYFACLLGYCLHYAHFFPSLIQLLHKAETCVMK